MLGREAMITSQWYATVAGIESELPRTWFGYDEIAGRARARWGRPGHGASAFEARLIRDCGVPCVRRTSLSLCAFGLGQANGAALEGLYGLYG